MLRPLKWMLICAMAVLAIPLPGEVGLIIRPGELWRYRVGSDPPPEDWSTVDLDDSGWEQGPSGFSLGFSRYDEATVLDGFSDAATSLFLRHTFVLTNLSDMIWPALRMDYDDGFVAYLNGTEIARRGLEGDPGETVPHDSVALPHPRAGSEEIDLRPWLSRFLAGTNVLALQVHKRGVASEDATIAVMPELVSGVSRGPFLQNMSHSGATVVWKTTVASEGWVEYGPHPLLGMTTAAGVVTNHHTQQVVGLQPDTQYFYRVCSSDGEGLVCSEVRSFVTSNPSGDVRFAVLGDTGVGQVPQYRLAGQLAGLRDHLDLVLHAGDIVYPQFTEARADSRLFSVYHDLMSSIPWYFCIGNHDLYAGETHYLNSFRLPQATLQSGQRYYSFDRGDIHFAVLMVPYLSQYQILPGDAQYQWLTNDLAATEQPWKVMLFHVPMQTSANHRLDDFNLNGIRDSDEIREVLLPVAQQYGVQVVFSGHDHVLERFVPTNGVHSITTGGGGVELYGFSERDASSAQFWQKHHFLDVQVTGNRMEIRAIDTDGEVFDSQVIHRAPPADTVYSATWHTPTLEIDVESGPDGNIDGQTFDLIGEPMGAMPGAFAALGDLLVNNDRSSVYIGLRGALLRDDSIVYLFVASPRLSGVTSMAGLGDGLLDPAGEGVDGLDMLENVSFAAFEPSVALVLGDEKSDGIQRSLVRPGQSLSSGQGIFRLNAGFEDVGGQIQQFNRSPEQTAVTYEQNADLIEVSIPYSALGDIEPEDVIQIGAIVAGDGHDMEAQTQRLDTAYLGTTMSLDEDNGVVLTGIRVRLAADPDRDGDGLPNDWELANGLDPDDSKGLHGAAGDVDGDGADNLHEYRAGTDPGDPQSVFRMWLSALDANHIRVHWNTVPGVQYSVEQATNDTLEFSPVLSGQFPVTAGGDEEVFTNEVVTGIQLMRIQRVK